ncbi:MAG: hypothetical protein K2L02_06935 [Clostridia bacterium]|nr:hypothetical protein [Clostridia bacterium]
MKSRAYLEEIRKSEGLERAILKDIIVEGTKATFRLITDKTYSGEDVNYATKVSQKYAPAGFTAVASVMKSVPEGAAVSRFIKEYLAKKYPVVSAFVEDGDVRAEAGAGGGTFVVKVGRDEATRFSGTELIDALTKELSLRFCGVWSGEVELRKSSEYEIKEEEEPEEYVLTSRSFPIEDYIAIDGAKPARAIYIADLNSEAQDLTVCGNVMYAEERTSKNGKSYFIFTVTDGTGQLRAAYFTKKATVEKVRKIQRGDFICLTGNNEIYNGGLAFTANKVDFGMPPKGFEPEQRPSLPVPARYKKVVPVSIADYEQSDLFGKETLPQDLISRDFVVFDLETTGLNNSDAGGMMDHVIEIGAVRIHEGRIVEKFASFVACPVRISEEITRITGIDSSMLAGAPEVGEVMADFYKFSDGAALVGHNVQFDIKFVRHYAGIEGYRFEHRLYDTLTFAQQVLRLSNYKLNTVADHFNFKFNHHRAYDDAYVTAKVFIELARTNKGLPQY